MDITSAVGFETKQFRFCYTTRDLIIYALGIGCSSEILDEKRYIFELHRDFCEFPTFFSTLPFKGDSHDIVPFPGPTLLLVPPDFVQVLLPGCVQHYSQKLVFVRPLNPGGDELFASSKIIGIQPRADGCVVQTESVFRDMSSNVIGISTSGIFIKGAVVQDNVGISPKPDVTIPTTSYSVETFRVPTDLAYLYRLSGDYNPLHCDEKVSAVTGLEGPILHGLCTLAIATRMILKSCNCRNTSCLKEISCRFSKPVFPGDILEVRIWKDDRHQELYLFEVWVPRRKNRVVVGGSAMIARTGGSL